MPSPNDRFVNPEMHGEYRANLLVEPSLEQVVEYSGKKKLDYEAVTAAALEYFTESSAAWRGSDRDFPTYGGITQSIRDNPEYRFGFSGWRDIPEPSVAHLSEVADYPSSAADWAPYRFPFDRWMAYGDMPWGNEYPRPAADVCVLTAEEEAAVEPSRSMLERYALEVETVADDLTAQLAVEVEDLCGYSLLRKRLKLASPLKRALHKLGIEPLRLSAVNRYKREMVLFHTAEMKRNKTWTPVSRLAWVNSSLSDCSRYGIEVPEFALARCVSIAKEMKESNAAVNFSIDKLADIDPFMLARTSEETFFIDVWDESKFEANL